MIEVIAFGPPAATNPHIPDYVVVRDGPVLLKALQGQPPDFEVSLTPLLKSGEAMRLEPPIAWQRGSWLVIENSPSWILNDKLEEWRSLRSQEILMEAVIMQDPETKMARLKTAGRIAGVPVETLITRLESARKSPNERLEDIYKRVKSEK